MGNLKKYYHLESNNLVLAEEKAKRSSLCNRDHRAYV